MEVSKTEIANFKTSISDDLTQLGQAVADIGNPDYDPNDSSTQNTQQTT